MKAYFLMHKDIKLAAFMLNSSVVGVDIFNFVVDVHSINYLPLPIKLIVNSYISNDSNINGNTLSLDEDGCFKFEQWLRLRTIPVDRINYERYYPKNIDSLKVIIKMNAVSFTDCYWVMDNDDRKSWNEVNLYGNSRVDKFENIEYSINNGGHYSKENFTLGGRLEKYWFVYNNQLMLAKRTLVSEDILNVREVIASKIYENLGIDNSARYSYIYNRNKEIVGCKCNVLTDEMHELATAYDLLSERNWVIDGRNSIEDLKICLRSYNAPVHVFENLVIMLLVDYLITNRDRHLNNIAFIRNSDILQILSIAIFDNGSSSYLEDTSPEGSKIQ